MGSNIVPVVAYKFETHPGWGATFFLHESLDAATLPVPPEVIGSLDSIGSLVSWKSCESLEYGVCPITGSTSFRSLGAAQVGAVRSERPEAKFGSSQRLCAVHEPWACPGRVNLCQSQRVLSLVQYRGAQFVGRPSVFVERNRNRSFLKVSARQQ